MHACTADGVAIEPGLPIWNLNLERDRVLRIHHTEAELIQGVPTGRTVTWWITERGLFDGARMSTRHPGTGDPADPLSEQSP